MGNAIISYLELNKKAMSALMLIRVFMACQIDAEDKEKLWIYSEIYTKYFVVLSYLK